ncbi:MAG: SURF1 family protein [Roseococcus sp.]
MTHSTARPIPWERLILPSFLALPLLALLLGLGSWQVQRLAWKEGLLAELAAAQARPPIEAPTNPLPFAHVTANGRFRPGAEALLGLEVRGPVLGGSLIAVLDRPGAPPLLVERGWVPLEGGQITRPEGEVTVTGYARFADRRSFLAARDDPAGRRFYSFDPRPIAQSLGVPEALPYALTSVVPAPPLGPSGLGSTPAPQRGPVPDAAHGFPSPGNPHLGYAITWFGLALAWTAIFLLWASRRIRET